MEDDQGALGPLINDIECRTVVVGALKLDEDHPMTILNYKTEPLGDDVQGLLGEYYRLTVDTELLVSIYQPATGSPL